MRNLSEIDAIVDHLFRRESGKLIAVLTGIFGPHNLQMAEDVVQDTLLKAMDSWKYRGVPENPSAWLFKVAKNQALDIIRKQKTRQQYEKSISSLLNSEYSLAPLVNELMNKEDISDDQLRMMFTCCHPSLPLESQVALILKTLCGFSIGEIAKAFITNNDTIEKRLYRAKQQFREQKIEFLIPDLLEAGDRLENVLTAIYLLFNEGYNSTSHEVLIRKDLIEESLRLGSLLIRHPSTRHPKVYALLSLMYFNSARSNARQDKEGKILLLKEQNRSLWNCDYVRMGLEMLDESVTAEELSVYHLQAGIAREHMIAPSYERTNWNNILHLYDVLYQLNPSPVVALNRAIVVGEIFGPKAGIEAIEKIPEKNTIEKYYLLPATLGEFHHKMHEPVKAKEYFLQAMCLTQSMAEKNLLQKKISALE